jgi:hypothetical protein
MNLNELHYHGFPETLFFPVVLYFPRDNIWLILAETPNSEREALVSRTKRTKIEAAIK